MKIPQPEALVNGKQSKLTEKTWGFGYSPNSPSLSAQNGPDIIQDLNKLKKAYNKALSLPDTATDEEKEDAQLSSLDLEIFERCLLYYGPPV